MQRLAPRLGRRPLSFRRSLVLESLETRALLTTFVVTNVNNAGAGSLRQAILDATAAVAPNTVTFNIAGSGAHSIALSSPLPILTNAVTIDGTTQPGFSSTPLIELDGTGAGTSDLASGIHILASNCVVKGLVINRFAKQGINIESGNQNLIQGNFIGTDLSGSVARPNGAEGIFIGTASQNTIGGDTPEARNIISGNKAQGIHFLFQTATANVIQGNYIGTDVTGSQALANQANGIDFFAPATFNTIGGTGTARNLISGNGGSGISFFGGDSTDNLIIGNFIGTDVSGTAPVANHGKGIDIFGPSRISMILNLISGNTDVGINLGGDYGVVQGNTIGAGVSGTTPLANQNNGISFGFGGKYATIGGTVPGQGNIVAFNVKKGIAVAGSSVQVSILGNSVFSNGGVGLDLNDDGVTLNTPGGPHTGSNLLQNYPVLTTVTSGTGTSIAGTLDSAPNATFRIELFANDSPDPTGYGEGRYFLGSTTVTTDGAGQGTFQFTTSGNLNPGQTVVATATDAGGNTSEFSANVVPNIVTPGRIQFASAGYTVTESVGLATISVTRSGGNMGIVTVPYSTGNGTATPGIDYSVASGFIVFLDGETGTKTFTIPIINDPIAEQDETIPLSLGTPTGGATLGLLSTSSVTILDNDAAGILVSPTNGLVTTEAGGSATFTVRLASMPESDVTIGLTSSKPSEGTANLSALTFTPSNWNLVQTVTVTGVDDSVKDGTVAYVIVTAPAVSSDPTYNGMDASDVALTNQDDDSSGVVVTPLTGLVTTEAGGSATFTVRLASQPTAAVTISMSSDHVGEGTISNSSLSFNTANWNVAQTVVVTGVDDWLDDGDVAYLILLGSVVSTDSKYNGLDVPDVSVTNVDNDTAGISVTPSTGLVTSERGGSATFCVVLTSQPLTNVTIGLSSSNTAEGTINKSTLTFTPATWNVAQVVTVLGVDDGSIDGDVAFSIVSAAANSTDPAYNGINPADVSVVNTDDDVASVLISPTIGLVTSERGGSASFTVRLASKPTADVTIGLTSSNLLEGTISTTTLMFTPTGWNLFKTVTIVGVDDSLIDGNVSYTIVTTNASSADSHYGGLAVADVSVLNTDDDSPGFAITPVMGLVTTELGGTATFTVRLTAQPSSNVTLPLSSSKPTEGTISVSSLTFTPANWNDPQAVTVTGVDDLVTDGAVAYSIVTGSSTSLDLRFAGLDPADVSVSNTDNDVIAVFVTPTAGLVTTESGGTAGFTVRLGSQPLADVVINVWSANPVEGSVNPSTLTFTSSNWNVDSMVMITGLDDNVADGDAPYFIITDPAISADPNYNGLNPANLSVVNRDNDVVAVLVTPTAGLTTSENGGSADFSVKLGSQPAANVTIAVTTSNSGEGTVSVSSLTFTTSNWNTPKSVTVTGVDDNRADGSVGYTVVLGAAVSFDPKYNGLNPPDVSVTNTDNDVVSILVTPTSGLTTTESGGTANFTVRLGSQPSQNVTIALASANLAEGTLNVPSLTFTPSDWEAPRTVTITGADDDLADGAVAYKVTLAPAVSGDSQYSGLDAPDISLTNTDNDHLGIVVLPGTDLSTTESGGTASFAMRLGSRPTANVTVPLSSSNTGEGTLSTASLVFTPFNWSQLQTVIVKGVDDQVDDGDVSYLIITGQTVSADPDYVGIVLPSVGFINKDDDAAGITITPTSNLVTTEQGGSATFTVRLSSQPRDFVTIPLTASRGGEATLSATSLTFDPSNWNLPQTVTVTGAADSVADGDIGYEIVPGAASSNDAKYQGIRAASVSLVNKDNLPAPLVTVTSVRLSTVKVKKTKQTSIVIAFSGEINAVTAQNLSLYGLASAGKDKKYGTKDDVRTPLSAAVYDAVAHTVTLRPKSAKFAVTTPLRLQILGAGLLDLKNRPIDGDRDGQAGGTSLAMVTKAGATLQSVRATMATALARKK